MIHIYSQTLKSRGICFISSFYHLVYIHVYELSSVLSRGNRQANKHFNNLPSSADSSYYLIVHYIISLSTWLISASIPTKTISDRIESNESSLYICERYQNRNKFRNRLKFTSEGSGNVAPDDVMRELVEAYCVKHTQLYSGLWRPMYWARFYFRLWNKYLFAVFRA